MRRSAIRKLLVFLIFVVLLLLLAVFISFRGRIKVVVNNDLEEDIYVIRIEEKDYQTVIPKNRSVGLTYKITKAASINLELKAGQETFDVEIVGYAERSYRGKTTVTVYNENGMIRLKVESNVSP